MAERCSFDYNVITITQYGGIVHGVEKEFNAVSHKGYRATDITISSENKLYAPCKVKCIHHRYISEFGCVISLFETVNEVLCADNQTRKMTFMLCHGGKANGVISTIPSEGTTYLKGSHIYQMGTDGGVPVHIHMDILEGTVSDENGVFDITQFNDSIVQILQPDYNYIQVNAFDPTQSLNFGDVFFVTKSLSFTESYGVKDEWQSDIFFEYYGFSGWQIFLDRDYYFENEIMKKGWLSWQGAWFYLDYTTGVMKTGWAADGNKWYYLNPTNGHMITGWFWDDEKVAWYYLNPNNGGAMQTHWLTEGGKLYYLGNDGKMYKDRTEKIDGVFYKFDNSGVATVA